MNSVLLTGHSGAGKSALLADLQRMAPEGTVYGVDASHGLTVMFEEPVKSTCETVALDHISGNSGFLIEQAYAWCLQYDKTLILVAPDRLDVESIIALPDDTLELRITHSKGSRDVTLHQGGDHQAFTLDEFLAHVATEMDDLALPSRKPSPKVTELPSKSRLRRQMKNNSPSTLTLKET